MIPRVYAHFFMLPVLNHLLSCKDAMVPVFHRKCFPSWLQRRREDSGKIGFPFFDPPPLRLFQPKMVGNGDLKNLLSFQTWWCFFYYSCGRHKKNQNKRLNMLGGFLNFPHHRFLSKKVSKLAHLKHICHIWVHLHWIMQTKSLKPPRSNNNWLNNFFAASNLTLWRLKV